MRTVRRALRRWADRVEAERSFPLVYTVTTARGTTGPFILNP